MSEHDPIVHIVDDDADLCQSLVFLLESIGVAARTYPDGATFLAEFDPDEPAVLVVDVRMPGLSGFQLQEQLIEREYAAALIFCSAHGDIAMSVRALPHGAVEFLEKPYEPQRMLDVVQEQLAEAPRRFAAARQRKDVQERLARLTAREREVLRYVVAGVPSQRIAHLLGASVKTIDVHRTRIRAKAGAESLNSLMREILQHRIDV